MRSLIFLFAIALKCLSSNSITATEPPPKPTAITPEAKEFFEKQIRPVLVEHCYECHSTQSKNVKGGLLLDSQPGLAKGGDNGAVIVPGNVEKSRLIEALRWTDPDFTMPPKKKLTAAQIEKFEQWVKMGAPDPRTEPAKETQTRTIDIAAGKKWWAFQPVNEVPPPGVSQPAWVCKKIDAFVLHGFESKSLSPSPPADPRTLIQRAYLDLTGLRPTYEQTEAFAKNPSADAYQKVIEKLLDSPQYGQRWGRYWLDVVRYGEDNPTSEATTPPYPYAWRYRDWVIDALNRDLPYDKFITLQLAADLIPNTSRSDLIATGFLGIGPIYHKDGRLSKDVIENLYMDDWDERVDVVSRGILGLTVACARCHDHKFDPISTRDYYSLAGVFSSTVAVPRTTAVIDEKTESLFITKALQLFYLSYVANLMRDDPGSKPKEARKKVERFLLEMESVANEIALLKEKNPDLHAYLSRLDRRPNPYDTKPGTNPMTKPRPGRATGQEPFFHSVLDAGVWIDGKDADLTFPDIKPGRHRDLNVLAGGNVSKPRELAPRGFPLVLSSGKSEFSRGSGRLELAEKLFTDAAPLTARVIVNRVWAWHFGKPIVETPSDFGIQGEKPSHPQLLEDLAARFISSGWSLKWLHREIMLSNTYQQASRPRAEAIKIDPMNRSLWRMNPRRLDIEAYRDCILQAGGNLDLSLNGPSRDLEQAGNARRTVYGRISRGRVSNVLQIYGFPEATMHSPGRETTTTPIQQLYVMNGAFLRDQASVLAERVKKESDERSRVIAVYRYALGRDPSSEELEFASEYLADEKFKDFVHAVLCTNEVIYWP